MKEYTPIEHHKLLLRAIHYQNLLVRVLFLKVYTSIHSETLFIALQPHCERVLNQSPCTFLYTNNDNSKITTISALVHFNVAFSDKHLSYPDSE
jgi:hypothetical protein